MQTCVRCGQPLGADRSCDSCGQVVDRSWGTDTAERPAVPDVRGSTPADPIPPPSPVLPTPPPFLPPPGQPRFPLYADEVDPAPLPSGPPPLPPPPIPPPIPPVPVPPAPLTPPVRHHREPRRRPAWLPWVLVALALVLTAALGGVLLVAGGDDDPARESATTGSVAPAPSGTPLPTATPTPAPTASPSGAPTEQPADPGPPENVARFATAAVPGTAEPNQDVDGNLVRYEARNMLDDVRTTCWRTPGDASGQTITLTLDGPTTLSRVGLVNGYAKTSETGSGSLNWYRGNRRVLAVEWTFDDGTTVSQSLADTRTMQTLDIAPVVTGTVTLRLVDVSSPGAGPSGRDYTAISDLALVGTPTP